MLKLLEHTTLSHDLIETPILCTAKPYIVYWKNQLLVEAFNNVVQVENNNLSHFNYG